LVPHPARRSALALLVFALSARYSVFAHAAPASDEGGDPAPQAWPRRAIQITVAYPPGGVSDQMARALADVLANQLGVPVLVENRAGASGTLALDLLVRRESDGHALCFVASTAIALRTRTARTRNAAFRAVVPVAGVMRTPILIVGTRSLDATTFQGMLERARRVPGSIRWATTGEGTTGHAVLDRVRRASGADIVHIPYKGGGQQLTDALAGHFEVLSTNVAASQIEDVATGRFKALAVGAPVRLAVLPQVPTLAELGFDDANLDSLFGLFAPPGLPPSIAEAINGAVATALNAPDLQARLRGMNNTLFEGSVEAFAQQVAREASR
jgi:tripartite-type tricarboxylate transporter receptor subunit TctC